jgi:hypothetical protein
MKMEIALSPHEVQQKGFRENVKKGDTVITITFRFRKRNPSTFHDSGVTVVTNHVNSGTYLMNVCANGNTVFPTHVAIATFQFQEKLRKMGIDNSKYDIELIGTYNGIVVKYIEYFYECGDEKFYFPSWTLKSVVKRWLELNVHNHADVASLMKDAIQRLELEPTAIENGSHWIYGMIDKYPHLKK